MHFPIEAADTEPGSAHAFATILLLPPEHVLFVCGSPAHRRSSSDGCGAR